MPSSSLWSGEAPAPTPTPPADVVGGSADSHPCPPSPSRSIRHLQDASGTDGKGEALVPGQLCPRPLSRFQAPLSDLWMSLPSPPAAPALCPLKGLPSRLPAPWILPPNGPPAFLSPPLPSPARAHPAVAVNLAKLKLFRHYYIMVRALFSLKQVFGGVLSLFFCGGGGVYNQPLGCPLQPLCLPLRAHLRPLSDPLSHRSSATCTSRGSSPSCCRWPCRSSGSGCTR